MHAAHENRLIAALPRKDRQHLLGSCQYVELVLGDVLSKPNEPMHHVYFPTDGYISLVSPIDSHGSLEIALVGNEGVHGVSLALGVGLSSYRATVEGEGSAYRMRAALFRGEMRYSHALHKALNRYIYARMTQFAQMAICTRFHIVEARLARWLLVIQDRAFSNELHFTQEFLAHMLGVRRVGITKAAGSLQKRKLISYSRGTITIHDRSGLEDASCGCYLADKASYDRIMVGRLLR